MPISILSWANLNHALCSASDPFEEFFGLGETYYFWATGYWILAFPITALCNYIIVNIVQKLIHAISGEPPAKLSGDCT